MLAPERHCIGELHVSMRAVSGRIENPSYSHTCEDVCEFQDVGVGGGQHGQEAVAQTTGDCGKGGGQSL